MPRGKAMINGNRNPCAKLTIDSTTDTGIIIKIRYPQDNLAMTVDRDKLIGALAHQDLIHDPRITEIDTLLRKVSDGVMRQEEFYAHVHSVVYPEPPFEFPTSPGMTIWARMKTSTTKYRFTHVNGKWVGDDFKVRNEATIRENYTDFTIA